MQFRPLFAALVLISTPAGALEGEPWRPVTAETGQIRDVEGLEQIVQDFPDSGSARLRLLQPYLEAGESEKLLATLAWLKERGYVFSEVAQAQISKLIGEEFAERAISLLIPEARSIQTSEMLDIVPAEAKLVESALYDPVDGRLIVTSVISKSVFGRKSHGDWDGYALKGAANISGIARSPVAHIIWLAAGHIDGSEGEGNFSGLIGLDHSTNKEIRIAAPEGVNISDISVGPDGTIYASDPLGGGVYFASSMDEVLSVLVAPGNLRSPQGLAVNADGTLLYVSDYRYGIAIVDLESGAVSRLTTDVPVILDGVDGLWSYGNDLVAMQNGTSPMRITRFQLSEDGMRVTEHIILEQAHSEWTEPLGGSIDGDRLVYVANGQWDRYVSGRPAQGKPALPTQIRTLLLD